ncbi:uncharacterized protein LOC132265282 [Phlebotomus argentipes]|uniref:uncharacterized protein LOC132265282 n=1 Tax=Phlebotomus argentipes TaxID=94469 RepID=UPI0028931B0F|nr:uncharacterized protein LOC132265282 [Phlebotomus argentipes]
MDHVLNRKRSREEEDVSMDFMPLSKRINNLHLTATSLPQIYDSSSSNSEVMNQNYTHPPNNGVFCSSNPTPGPFYNVPKGLEMRQEMPESVHMSEYCPELSILENPYYFLKNKLLFELHTQRLKRSQCFDL